MERTVVRGSEGDGKGYDLRGDDLEVTGEGGQEVLSDEERAEEEALSDSEVWSDDEEVEEKSVVVGLAV